MNGLNKDPEVLATFKEEAYDRFAELELGVSLLDKAAPNDIATIVHDLFRSAHSLKATANLLGFTRIEKASKSLEDILHSLRKNDRSYDAQTAENLVRLLDEVGLGIDAL